MTQKNSFQSLGEQGDPFEILISKHVNDLGPVLHPYAEVWDKHIRPRRIGNGTSLEAAWMPFGGSHYTALIRLYHAYESRQEVIKLCEELQATAGRDLNEGDFEKLLRLNAACAAMWENLGSAIDNFRAAKFEGEKLFGVKTEETSEKCETCGRPMANQYKTAGGPLSEASNPKLYYAYQRRTQFIHSRIVPTQIEDGMVVFNCVHFKDERTRWPAYDVKPEQLDHIIAEEWKGIFNELSSEWWTLFASLQANDRGPAVEWVPRSGFTHFQSVSSPDESALQGLYTKSTSGNFGL